MPALITQLTLQGKTVIYTKNFVQSIETVNFLLTNQFFKVEYNYLLYSVAQIFFSGCVRSSISQHKSLRKFF